MGILTTSKKIEFTEQDYKVLNNIKALGIDMINEANSGHPGIVLGAAPILYDLFAKHLVFNPDDDKWINRDRFILSAGHGSALLYATLFMSGYPITIEDLKDFRKIDSITPGHPEYNKTPGIEATTGPLGQGFAMAVGMAMAEKFQNTRYLYSKDASLINHYTYVLCSDGDLMEGISYEAASIAGNLGLGKLIVLYDSNNVTLDNNTNETFKENVLDRFKAMNWDTFTANGEDLNEIDSAIARAREIKEKPSIIEFKTILGKGSKLQNTSDVHGKPLTEEDITYVKKSLGIRDVAFTVSNDSYSYMKEHIMERNLPLYDNWHKKFASIKDKIKEEYQVEIDKLINNDLAIDMKNFTLEITEDLCEAPRDTSHRILNKLITEELPVLVGSADVASSTKLYLDNMGNFLDKNPKGRNILFGVREHAMGAILNGLTLSEIRVIGSTFLTFSDYLKPAIRMSALMKLPVIYIFTHDSIEVGEDGPTHQPIEQLIGLRSIPNVTVYRPCDANEIIGAYKSAMKNINGPSIIILSKDKTDILEATKINEVDKGGYILLDDNNIDGIIISTGKELSKALNITNKLKDQGINVRLVSMPSIERFNLQSAEYKEKILPLTIKKIVIEFSSPYSWYNFVYNEKYLFTVNEFGQSGNREDILNSFSLNEEIILNKIKDLLK